MIKSIIITLLLVTIVSDSQAGTVYMCENHDGSIIISQLPCSASSVSTKQYTTTESNKSNKKINDEADLAASIMAFEFLRSIRKERNDTSVLNNLLDYPDPPKQTEKSPQLLLNPFTVNTMPRTGGGYKKNPQLLHNPFTGNTMPHTGGVYEKNPQLLLDPFTGNAMPRTGAGYTDPRTGTFYQDAGGGVVNTRTGEFIPTH
ncbi:MAG: hypothetical protein COZ07_05135 [Candidatus Infernicultor aquiphilus]|uniref:DUF4124 domain-containing protein n=1 Tax=Candidatus Infernicultor aquiphilus TaxID=1805029 RepID=A0A2M7PPQ5_9BACT|nr:MAG: hypothetical protein COZ07_05135 [Candidatus Atribacteria bacterium CG_4_10_14_3_um_filter_34_13]